MNQLVGIIGSGLIGIDPFDSKSWSGISKRFFLECQSQDILSRAFGVEVSKPVKYLLALKNFSSDRRKLIRQYYMDPCYLNALTELIRKQLTEEDMKSDILQIGGMYDVPTLVKKRTKCYSYNDGNFASSVNTRYFPKGISTSKIDNTLRYERDVNHGLDMIFTMSEYLRVSFINDYDIPPERVVSIGAGINLDRLPDCAEQKDYTNGNILFIGVDFARKGGFELVKAFKVVRERIPAATLHIVGPRNRIAGVSDLAGVVWHGYLDKYKAGDMAKLNSLFLNASLFVMPSLYEPFGIAPLEALAYEIPCVVSNAWALPEIVPENVCGRLVPPGNWEEMAEVLIPLLKDPSMLERFGKAGRMHVENTFTWENVVVRLKAVLTGLGERQNILLPRPKQTPLNLPLSGETSKLLP